MEGNTAGAAAPQAEQATRERTPKIFPALDHSANAYAASLSRPDRAICLGSGDLTSGEFQRYMSVEGARELAAALIAAADHYEAETARLAQAGAP